MRKLILSVTFSLLSFIFFLVFFSSLVNASEPYFNANAVWIQDAGWPRLNPYILSKNLTKVIDDLTKNHIKYAIVMVGYYDGSSPNSTVLWQRTTTGGYMDGGPPNVTFYTSIVNALHAANITAIAWIEDTNGPIDVRPSNWNNLISQINLTLQWGFDGYSDDIETITGTWQDYINWLNNVTVWLHSLGKLSMPAVGYDWRMDTNPYLHVDYIVTMFYGPASLFDPSNPYSYEVEAYWQENFGMYGGRNNPPASPVILGIMNFYGNRYPLAWQLDRAGYLIKKYGAPQLKGFSLWLYEYMGTNPTDWGQWNYWITHVNTTYSPPLNILNITTSPMTGVPMMFEGTDLYKLPFEPFFSPKLEYLFNGTVSITAPSTAVQETHYVLFGDSDHTGGSMGYSVYTYAGGPYNLTSSASINSLYFYCKATGNVKVAIYNATKYHIEGWVGTDYHPYGLITKSNATPCVSNSWVLINVTPVTLPAGIYFIAIKGGTTGIIGASGVPPQPVGGDIYGYNQFITEDYNTAFKQIFPTVEGAMGEEPSVYVPTAPMILTNYNFSHWENGETALTRYVNANGNRTIIAYYTTEVSLRRISGKLTDKNNNPINAKIIVFQQGTDSIISSNQTDSQGNYDLTIPTGIYDIQFNLTNFFVKILSVNISQDLISPIKQITSEENKLTILLESNYSNRIKVYSLKKPLKVKLNETIPSWDYNETNKIININISVILAKSGYPSDIQEAINWIIANGGGTVYIPAGDWVINQSSGNAINIDLETLPEGAWLNIIGSESTTTTTTQNGVVITAPATILRQGVLPSGFFATFSIVGSNTSYPANFNYVRSKNKHIRISRLTILNYVTNDTPAANQNNAGIFLEYVDGFLIDNVFIDSNTNAGINVQASKGVIANCSITQYYHKVLGPMSGWGYGVAVFGNSQFWSSNLGTATWITNVDSIIGKYDWQGITIQYRNPQVILYNELYGTNYSEYYGSTNDISYTAGPVYIEDCFFDYTRHPVSSAQYGYYVLRNSVIKHPLGGLQSIDIHGRPFPSGRYAEIYNNILDNVVMGVAFRGGGGLVFNNTFINNIVDIQLANEYYNSSVYDPQYIDNVWIWDNNHIGTGSPLNVWANQNITPGINYFTDSWKGLINATNPSPPKPNYIPYPYPHPLRF